MLASDRGLTPKTDLEDTRAPKIGSTRKRPKKPKSPKPKSKQVASLSQLTEFGWEKQLLLVVTQKCVSYSNDSGDKVTFHVSQKQIMLAEKRGNMSVVVVTPQESLHFLDSNGTVALANDVYLAVGVDLSIQVAQNLQDTLHFYQLGHVDKKDILKNSGLTDILKVNSGIAEWTEYKVVDFLPKVQSKRISKEFKSAYKCLVSYAVEKSRNSQNKFASPDSSLGNVSAFVRSAQTINEYLVEEMTVANLTSHILCFQFSPLMHSIAVSSWYSLFKEDNINATTAVWRCVLRQRLEKLSVDKETLEATVSLLVDLISYRDIDMELLKKRAQPLPVLSVLYYAFANISPFTTYLFYYETEPLTYDQDQLRSFPNVIALIQDDYTRAFADVPIIFKKIRQIKEGVMKEYALNSMQWAIELVDAELFPEKIPVLLSLPYSNVNSVKYLPVISRDLVQGQASTIAKLWISKFAQDRHLDFAKQIVSHIITDPTSIPLSILDGLLEFLPLRFKAFYEDSIDRLGFNRHNPWKQHMDLVSVSNASQWKEKSYAPHNFRITPVINPNPFMTSGTEGHPLNTISVPGGVLDFCGQVVPNPDALLSLGPVESPSYFVHLLPSLSSSRGETSVSLTVSPSGNVLDVFIVSRSTNSHRHVTTVSEEGWKGSINSLQSGDYILILPSGADESIALGNCISGIIDKELLQLTLEGLLRKPLSAMFLVE